MLAGLGSVPVIVKLVPVKVPLKLPGPLALVYVKEIAPLLPTTTVTGMDREVPVLMPMPQAAGVAHVIMGRTLPI